MKRFNYFRLLIIVVLLNNFSCTQSLEILDSPHSLSNDQMELLSKKMASSFVYKEIVLEISNMNKQAFINQLKINNDNLDYLQNKIKSSKNKLELEEYLSLNFSKPSIVIESAEKLTSLFLKLDHEINFSQLSIEQRKQLIQVTFQQSSSKSVFNLAFNKKSQLRISDCGGDCNKTYYQTIETAAETLIAATVVAAGAGALGGPAGMAGGAIGVAGAVVAYFIVENAALEALGVCFDGCFNK